jgi:predicted metal-dependent phosphoesterase TrpH
MTRGFYPLHAVPGTATLPQRVGADLHVHTTHSDGVCSPCEVVAAAAAVGLAALAITDHDTVTALSIARPEALRCGVELIDGVELTCCLDGREVHLLGYFIHVNDSPLLDAMNGLQAGRSGRLEAMAERLRKKSLLLDLEILRRSFPRAVLGRRHVAEYLARTGQVAGVRSAFTELLGDGRPAFVAKPQLDVVEAIGLIRGAGGVAALAHPPYNLRAETLRTLATAGLGGIEVAGPGISNRLGRRFRDWAAELHLVPVAGSDFHMADRPGRWVGATTTPLADVERLRRACSGNLSSDGPAQSVESSS